MPPDTEDRRERVRLQRRVATQRDLFAHGEFGKDAGGLEGAGKAHGDPLVFRQALDMRACEQDFTRSRGEYAGERVDRGRLARAVGADEAEDFALSHLEAEIIDGAHPAEELAQPVHLQNGGCHATLPCRPPATLSANHEGRTGKNTNIHSRVPKIGLLLFQGIGKKIRFHAADN